MPAIVGCLSAVLPRAALYSPGIVSYAGVSEAAFFRVRQAPALGMMRQKRRQGLAMLILPTASSKWERAGRGRIA
jgi:hypothetical protein